MFANDKTDIDAVLFKQSDIFVTTRPQILSEN